MKNNYWVLCIFLFMTGCFESEVPGDAKDADTGSDQKEKTASEIVFTDVSSILPPPVKYGDFGALWGDFDNNGLLDLIFLGHGAGPFILSQREKNSFYDISSSAGIKFTDWQYEEQSDRHGASCGDYNNDGKPDLYISHGAKRGVTLGIKHDELLRNDGDFFFTDIVQDAGVLNQNGRGRSGAWADYNNDGWLDLYVMNYQSDNVMYENNGDGTFSDVTDSAGLRYQASRAAWADYDKDGDIDLIIGWPLRLLRNLGNGTFEDRTQDMGVSKLFAYSFAWGDFDNDADLDLFVGRLGQKGALFENSNGLFQETDKKNKWGMALDDVGTGAAWGDLDNDGDLDLFLVRSQGYFVFENHGVKGFVKNKLPFKAPTITTNGDVALGDFNNDGLLDVAIDDPSGYVLLRNNSPSTNNWLTLQLSGRSSNRMGFGAKVSIFSEGRLVAYREYMGANKAFRSVGCGPIHVGLGEANSVEIKVDWPSGKTTTHSEVNINQALLITE